MKKVVRLTEKDLTNIVKSVIKEMDEHKVYNYFKIIDENGDTIGVVGVERGSRNEITLIENIFDMGYNPVKISEEEYENYNEGDEIKNY